MTCPVPVIRTGQALSEASAGAEIVVLADDPFTGIDLRAYCHAHRHEFIGQRAVGESIEIRIRKGRCDAVR